VACSLPFPSNVREIVVTGEDFSELDGAEALSGKVVAVARSLATLNRALVEITGNVNHPALSGEA
jgi:hypothetical protein